MSEFDDMLDHRNQSEGSFTLMDRIFFKVMFIISLFMLWTLLIRFIYYLVESACR